MIFSKRTAVYKRYREDSSKRQISYMIMRKVETPDASVSTIFS